MTEPLYISRAEVRRIQGTHRRARLADGTEVDFGVHGPIKAHYRLDDEKDLPLPVDYIVAATAGWMLGTLNGALEVRGIRLDGDAITASAEGTNEVVDGIITLTRIDIRYSLRIPAGSRETVDRALSRHRDKCPTAMSLRGAVTVEWTADIEEVWGLGSNSGRLLRGSRPPGADRRAAGWR